MGRHAADAGVMALDTVVLGGCGENGGNQECPDVAVGIPGELGSAGTVKFTGKVVAPEAACAGGDLFRWRFYLGVQVAEVGIDCQSVAGKPVGVGLEVLVAYDGKLELKLGESVVVECTSSQVCVESPDGGVATNGVDAGVGSATCGQWIAGCHVRCYGAAVARR